jgi:hypothetical protein
MIYMLFHAEIEGVICSGPRRGKQFTYALLEERVEPVKPLSRDESLARLAYRFFTSHGPATVQDMAKWSHLTVADARAGLDSVRSEFTRESVDGREYWGCSAADSLPAEIRDTHLLPIYDEYTIGYKYHAPVYDSAHGDKFDFLNLLVFEGKVSGTWKRVERKDSVLVQVKPFAATSKIDFAAVREAADRFSAFIEKPVELEWV